MTMPAAVFSQLAGIVMLIIGIGLAGDRSASVGIIMAAIGIALFAAGGYAIRQRIKTGG